MRHFTWILLLLVAGCKTVEVSVDYPMPLASVHIAAKVEAHDRK
jgi:hypothetical protein